MCLGPWLRAVGGLVSRPLGLQVRRRAPRGACGSRVGPRSQCGFLSQACRYGHVQHLEHLLFYGADMGAQNASGNTALHICALYNQVSLLGARPTPRPAWGPCPWCSRPW